MRYIAVPVGRGRSFKTNLADALYEELHNRGEVVTAWDIDKAPNLKFRVANAKRPEDASPSARQACLESAIHHAYGSEGIAVVDVGADEVLFHQITDKLPDMIELLAADGVEIIGIHVLGPDVDKDTAFFRATRDSAVFTREIVVLNHGLVRSGISPGGGFAPKSAFAAVEKLVNPTGLPVFHIRALPPEVMAAIWPDPDKKVPIRPLHDLADDPKALNNVINAMVLRSYLNVDIGPLINEILNVRPELPQAA